MRDILRRSPEYDNRSRTGAGPRASYGGRASRTRVESRVVGAGARAQAGYEHGRAAAPGQAPAPRVVSAPSVSPLRGLALEEAIERIAKANDRFLHGHCVALAIALKKELGGRLLALMEEDSGMICLTHAVLEEPDGMLIDVRGRRSLACVLADFADSDPWPKYMMAEDLCDLNYDYGGSVPAAIATRAAVVARQLAPLVRAQRIEAQT